ncbi:MAG: hypothetical protein IKE57_03605 [Oscillospiraceae bacterium]|nr:hypothetical protein [Oscillospiraceae bacterium]
MNRLESLNEISAPAGWRADASALWAQRVEAPAHRRILRPALITAAVLCLLATTVAGAWGIRSMNPVIVHDEKELQAAMDTRGSCSGSETAVGVAAPNEEQPSLETFLHDSAELTAHWTEDAKLGGNTVHSRQEWHLTRCVSSEGPLWERRAESLEGWQKRQFAAEGPERLNEAEPETITAALPGEARGMSPVPWGSRLELIRNADGELEGASSMVAYSDMTERYFQLEYAYEAEAVDWGGVFVPVGAYDEALTYTAPDGREFVITAYGDRTWASCVTPHETYHAYAIGLTTEETAQFVGEICYTVHS